MKDFPNILRAARSAGVVVGHNVRVHRFASSRGVGLVADAAIPAGTRVREVPERVWSLVSADAARGAIERSNPTLFRRVEAISARMVADAASFEGALHLALQIVGEGSDFREADRDATSFIATWRDVAIPSTLPSLPYFYDAVQLAQLRGSERSARSNTARRQFVAQIHAALFPPAADRSAAMAKALGEIGASAAPSLPQFERALAVVSSRVTTSSDGPGVTLLPVLDWLNHAAAEAVNCRHDYDASTRSFVVDATNDVAAGEELTISYGPHANSKLLRVYGFATPANAHDVALLRVRWQMWEAHRAQSAGQRGFSVADLKDAPPPPEDFELSVADPLPAPLLGAMRLWMCDAEEWAALRDGSGDGDPTKAPLSTRNERAAIGALGADVVAALERYETFGTEAEEALLRDSDGDGDGGGASGDTARHCALVRLGEKQILHAALQRLTVMRDALDEA